MFNRLLKFESTANPETFRAIFGETLCAHLWNKFTLKANRSITNFMRMLDTDNEQKLVNYFENPQVLCEK